MPQTGSPKTIAALNAEIFSNLPDNTIEEIIPFNERQILLDMVASGPIGTDAPTGLVVGTTTITGGTTGKILFDNGGVVGEISSATGGTLQSFGTVIDAQSTPISDNITTIQVQGYRTVGDGGAGSYNRVSSLPSKYSGSGGPVSSGHSSIATPPIPAQPGFASGIPNLCYSTTSSSHDGFGVNGPTTQPILAGCLALLLVFNLTGASSPPSTYVDSAGNTYVIAATDLWAGLFPVTVYYCANPVYAPPGTTFPGIGVNDSIDIEVYSFAGFTGATVHLHETHLATSQTGGTSFTSVGSASVPEFAFMYMIAHGYSGDFGADPVTNFVQPAGWTDIAANKVGRNFISCRAVSTPGNITFNPTWNVGVTTNALALLVTFTSAAFTKTVLDPSYWLLAPTWPMHTAAYGIDPSSPDNTVMFQQFGAWIASIAPPSNQARAPLDSGNPSGTCTISIPSSAGPGIVTMTWGVPPWDFNTGWPGGTQNPIPISQGQQISFSTTGQLPAPLVPGKRYFLRHGTLKSPADPTSPGQFQITAFTPFRSDGITTVTVGPAVDTSLATNPGNTQSGTHSFTIYDDSWAHVIFDPGVYYVKNMQFINGLGLRKLRVSGYGARLQGMRFTIGPLDGNANTDNTGVPFSAQFANATIGNIAVTLTNPALAVNFFPNTWALLTACETQPNDGNNWNCQIFEYKKIRNVNNSTGVITFFDPLEYSYRSTLPVFNYTTIPGHSGPVGLSGPGSIVQLSESFEQEIEVHGLSIDSAANEEPIGGILSARLVDCKIYGSAYLTGPFPTNIKKCVFDKCDFYNAVMEVDKEIDYLEFSDCMFIDGSALKFQSSCVNKTVFNRCRIEARDSIIGTPRRLSIRDSYFGRIYLGTNFGATDSVLLENTFIGDVFNNTQALDYVHVNDSGYSFSGGVIQVATGHSNYFYQQSLPHSLTWALPGTKVVICSNVTTGNSGASPISNTGVLPNFFNGSLGVFTVLDNYTDGSNNFCVLTNLDYAPSASLIAHGTVDGSGVLHVTAIKRPSDSAAITDGVLLLAMTISGGGLPADCTLANAAVPNSFGSPSGGLITYPLHSASSIPTISTPTDFTVSAPLFYLTHVCPHLSMHNCTGSTFCSDQASAPDGNPIFTYFKRAYDCATLSFQFHDILYFQGNLKYLKVDVIKPYTGSISPFIIYIYLFGWKDDGGGTGNKYGTCLQQTIDLRTSGVRTITASVAPTGIGVDVLNTVPRSLWLSGGHAIAFVQSPGGGDTQANFPRFVITAETEQPMIDSASLVTVGNNAGAFSGIDSLADTTSTIDVNI